MDTDNLAASVKCLLDALKYQPKVNPNFRGFIFDDSPEFIEARYFFEKAPMREGHVTILIEDIGWVRYELFLNKQTMGVDAVPNV